MVLRSASHDREPDPHLHPPRRRRRDAPRRHEPGAQDAPADRGLRHRRRAQRPARRRARRTAACPSATRSGCGASRTTCSTSAPTSRSPRAASASACACVPEQTDVARAAPATRSTPSCRALKSFVLPGGTLGRGAAARLPHGLPARGAPHDRLRRRGQRGVRALPQPALRPAVHPLARGEPAAARGAAVGAGTLPLSTERAAAITSAPSTARCAELHAMASQLARPLDAPGRPPRRRAGRRAGRRGASASARAAARAGRPHGGPRAARLPRRTGRRRRGSPALRNVAGDLLLERNQALRARGAATSAPATTLIAYLPRSCDRRGDASLGRLCTAGWEVALRGQQRLERPGS